jgi:uncharacterized protein
MKSYLNFLREMGCEEWVINHSHEVTLRALELSNDLKENYDIDFELVKKGALLHDIGRSKTNGIRHAIIGAEILKEQDYPLEIRNIVERHIGAGIPKNEAIDMGLPPKDYIPITLEEKIVAHADNLLNGSDRVNLDFVINKWSKRMGPNHPAIIRLKELDKFIVRK